MPKTNHRIKYFLNDHIIMIRPQVTKEQRFTGVAAKQAPWGLPNCGISSVLQYTTLASTTLRVLKKIASRYRLPKGTFSPKACVAGSQ